MNEKAYKDIRVYRFKVPLIKRGDIHDIELRAVGPVPILNEEEKILGFAVLEENKPNFAIADCAIDPSTPERLDLELGRLYWMDAVMEYRGFLGGASKGFTPTVAYIKALMLTTQRVPDQEPIDPKIAVLS